MTTQFNLLADRLEQAVARLEVAEERLDTDEADLSEAESLAGGILARIEFDLARTAAAAALLGLTQAVAKAAPMEGWRRVSALYHEAGGPGVRPLHRAVLDELEDREVIELLVAAVREADTAAA